MRFYVKSRVDNSKKLYIQFDKGLEPPTKQEVPFETFNIKDIDGSDQQYNKEDIQAEVGMEPIGGAIIGGLLFLIDPLIGVLGSLLGTVGVMKKEQEKVNKFNKKIT